MHSASVNSARLSSAVSAGRVGFFGEAADEDDAAADGAAPNPNDSPIDASIEAGEKDPKEDEEDGALILANEGAAAEATAADRRFFVDRPVRQCTMHHSIRGAHMSSGHTAENSIGESTVSKDARRSG